VAQGDEDISTGRTERPADAVPGQAPVPRTAERLGVWVGRDYDSSAAIAAAWGLSDNTGAVVAMDPQTGAILAMVSKPAYDPNRLASHKVSDVIAAYDQLLADPTGPLFNRAIAGDLYHPGSTFKLIVASAAIDTGKIDAVVIVPLGFVSDHMEVLWDLDTEASQAARERGLEVIRIATPGIHRAFVAGLVDLVLERLDGTRDEDRPALTELGPWYDVCRPACCENIRAGFKPAVAGIAP